MGLAGYKTISILFLIVLVALAAGSPVFAQPDGAVISFTPAAACPGATVTISNIPIIDDVVGGGMSIAAASPAFVAVVSSDPGGLVGEQDCRRVRDTTVDTVQCTFVVSESASCDRYTVTVTLPPDGFGVSVSGVFDVAGSCCAVGGCVQPVNTLSLLSPWLAIVGVVGCVGTVVVVTKKRHP